MKCFVTVVVIILFAVAASGKAPAKLPNYIKLCKAKDSDCLKNLLKELRSYFIQGIPKLNFPSIDPLNVPSYNQSDPHSPQLTYFSTFTDMKYEGLSNFDVLKFDIAVDYSKFDLKIMFPQVVVTAHQVVSADGFGISVNGGGLTKVTFSNLTINLLLNSKKFLTGEKVNLRWKEDAITVSFDGVVYAPDASFVERRNYKEILDVGNDEYPHIMNPQIQKAIKNTLGEFILRQINSIYEAYPTDVLYLAP